MLSWPPSGPPVMPWRSQGHGVQWRYVGVELRVGADRWLAYARRGRSPRR